MPTFLTGFLIANTFLHIALSSILTHATSLPLCATEYSAVNCLKMTRTRGTLFSFAWKNYVCLSLGDQAVNIDEFCLYLVVHLIFIRHKVDLEREILLRGQQEP